MPFDNYSLKLAEERIIFAQENGYKARPCTIQTNVRVILGTHRYLKQWPKARLIGEFIRLTHLLNTTDYGTQIPAYQELIQVRCVLFGKKLVSHRVSEVKEKYTHWLCPAQMKAFFPEEYDAKKSSKEAEEIANIIDPPVEVEDTPEPKTPEKKPRVVKNGLTKDKPSRGTEKDWSLTDLKNKMFGLTVQV